MHLVRRRGETLTHVSHLHHQYNLPPSKKLQYASNRDGIAETFNDPAVRFSVQTDIALLGDYDTRIREVELYLEQSAKVHDPNNFFLLQTIPGVGRIIGMTLLYEIHNIRRFPEMGDFLSYCRLVRGEHSSNGKSYGSPGRKMGNAYLKWAFSEIVPLLKRQSPEVKAWCERIEKKHGPARANSLLSVKLGRAVYCMLRRRQVFDLQRTNTRKKKHVALPVIRTAELGQHETEPNVFARAESDLQGSETGSTTASPRDALLRPPPPSPRALIGTGDATLYRTPHFGTGEFVSESGPSCT
jgi:hypothetical protein